MNPINIKRHEHIDSSKLFYELFPKVKYEECRGCHSGARQCGPVNNLHDKCPCQGCLVMTSCTQYCESFQQALKVAITNSPPMKIVGISYKGYAISAMNNGTRVIYQCSLRRYIDTIT